MPADVLTIGERMGPFAVVLDADMARALARATQDDTPRYRDGTALPPTAIATRAYAAQLESILELVPAALFTASRGGVHGEHDLLLHRAVLPGEPLQTTVELHSVKPSRDNVRITLLHRTFDSQAMLVAEQWWTTVLLGVSAAEAGPELPATGTVAFDPEQPVAEETVHIDREMVRRYAEVSGDFSPHHFDVEAAQQSGFDGPFLHGLCTMALCARAVVCTVGQDDLTRLRRLSVRFAAPAYVDQDLTVRLFALGEDRYALEATSGGSVAIRNGLAELGPAGSAPLSH